MSKTIIIGGMVQGTDQKTKKMEVADDVEITAAEALRQYFGVSSTADVQEKLRGHVVRVDNQPIDSTEIERTFVKSFVSVYPAQVAQGGVRGAAERELEGIAIQPVTNGFIVTVTFSGSDRYTPDQTAFIANTLEEAFGLIRTQLPQPVAA